MKDHKFRHNFLDTINPLCDCSLEIESVCHYLLHCPFFTEIRKSLIDNIIGLIGSLSNISDDDLVELLLYGDQSQSLDTNASFLKFTIIYLKSSERFDIPLL